MRQIREQTGICHFRVDRELPLSRFLAEADLSPLTVDKQIDRWLDLGCVYVDGQRRRDDTILRPDQIVRLHTRPKSYPRHFKKLRDHIAFEHEDFLVLDKPAGLPTHATLDNYKDNAKFILEQEMGCTLYTTHRLDIPTRGLLIIAKSSAAQAGINKLFAKGRVSKYYLALAERAIAPQPYDHYMNPVGLAPRTLSTTPQEGWWKCSLVVEEVHSVEGPFFQHKIRLLTGRTHQIRTQMSFLGAPLIGDQLYGSNVPFTEGIGLVCSELGFRWKTQDFQIRRS